MNEPTPELAPDPDELKDRLIDGALREVLGGETPPDLSERILAAAGVASTLPSAEPSTLTKGGPRMSHGTSKWIWAGFILAASLLVTVGLLVNNLNDEMHAARGPAGDRGERVKATTSASGTIESKGWQLSERSRDASGKEVDELGDIQTDAKEPLAESIGHAAGAAAAAPREETLSLSISQTQDVEGLEQAVPAAESPAPAAPFAPAAQPSPAPGDSLDAYAIAPKTIAELGTARGGGMGGGAAYFGWDHAADGVQLGRRFAEESELGAGAGQGGDQYAKIVDNPFKAISRATTDNRLSTFSIDVDTASYANVRQFLMQSGALPPPDAVRIEELVNYFDYDYSAPTGDVPFAANVEVASCPWNAEHRLARVGIKGREMDRAKRPKSNLVFLIDVSGSMDEPAKLPLLVEGMRLLTRELGENDRVAIAVYASSEGLALESTPGTEQDKILDVLDKLHAGGSTAGGAGVQLAYKVAVDNFIKGGVNRVILCTDGDFNVGVTSTAELERMAEEKAKDTGVFLTVLGFGRGNLNDAMMEKIADKGNGNYHYVDGLSEARKVLVEEMAGTLVTIAKDVKIQVEFNPAKVAGYRLIGYENRVLAAEDFNDDKKDAGEIGAGHTVTALYEIVPVGKKVDAVDVDDLKYDAPGAANAETEADVADDSHELLTLKIRYKEPDGDKSTKLEFPITDNGEKFAKASDDFKFASAVASFGMLLRKSEFKGDATYAGVKEIAESASNRDSHGYRKEFVEMVGKARELLGE